MKLTESQRAVLLWAARGKTVDDTAAILGRSPQMIKYYRRRAAQALDALTVTHAVVKAIAAGQIAHTKMEF